MFLARRVNAPAKPRPHAAGVAVWAGTLALLAAALTLGAGASAQTANPAATPEAAAVRVAAVARPLWVELKPEQQEALKPLAPHWEGLSELHKRKWLALSRDFSRLGPAEQATMHSRMTEWAALSVQQRAQARLNFAEVAKIAPDDRKAKWEAYQALSEEEKRKLADSAAPRQPGATVAPVRPVSAQRLAPVPVMAGKGQHSPRIQLAPPVAATAPAPAPAPAATPPAEAVFPLPAAAPAAAAVSAAAAAPAPAAAAPLRMTEQPSAAP